MPRPRPRQLLLGGASGRWRVGLVILGWLGVAAGLFGLVVRSIASGWQPLIVAAAFYPYWAVAALIGGVLVALQRVWTGALAALALTGTAVALLVPLYVADRPQVTGPPLTLLQANVRVGSARAGDLVSTVRAHHVDVLTVDELTAAELARLDRAGLGRVLPHRLVAPYRGGAGTGIWSRYPLTSRSRDDRFTFELLAARIRPPRAAGVDVVAVHLLPPWPYPSHTWIAELQRLRRRMTRSSAPLIVSGDDNATTDSPQFRALLRGGVRDAADEAGAGYLPTYPTDRFTGPLIAIDHVLLRGVAARDVSTVDLPGSDHRGLLTRLTVPAR